jgi:Tfp pilus assembly protein PilO
MRPVDLLLNVEDNNIAWNLVEKLMVIALYMAVMMGIGRHLHLKVMVALKVVMVISLQLKIVWQMKEHKSSHTTGVVMVISLILVYKLRSG